MFCSSTSLATRSFRLTISACPSSSKKPKRRRLKMSLFAEFKCRKVIRMAGLYLVGAWLLVQVAGMLRLMFGALRMDPPFQKLVESRP